MPSKIIYFKKLDAIIHMIKTHNVALDNKYLCFLCHRDSAARQSHKGGRSGNPLQHTDVCMAMMQIRTTFSDV